MTLASSPGSSGPSQASRGWRQRVSAVAGNPTMRYLVIVAVAAGTALGATSVPWDPHSPPYRICYHVVATIGLALALAGGWRDRARLRHVGVVLVGAVCLQYIGDIGSTIRILANEDRTWPYWTDPLFLASYVALMVGAMLTVHRRAGRRDTAALVDSAIITVGFAVLAYTFLISDAAVEDGKSLLGRSVGVAYLVCDVLVLGVVVRLIVSAPGRRGPAGLLATGLVSLLAGDVLFSESVLVADVAGYARWVDAAYVAFYPLVGAAMFLRYDSEAPPDARTERSARPRLVALAAGALLAPLSLLIADATGQDPHVRAVAVGAIVVFLLVVFRMWLLVRAVEAKSDLLEVLSRTDALTGLPNRRTFDHELDRSMTAAGSDFMLAGLSVGMLDLDRFKAFNDVHGHGAGDGLLVSAAQAWATELTALAPAATLSRYGGEEFAVVLPGASEVAAVAVLEQLLVLTPGGQSFSAGVAQWDGSESAAELLARADLRLYGAKAAGRRRVFGVTAEEPVSEEERVELTVPSG